MPLGVPHQGSTLRNAQGDPRLATASDGRMIEPCPTPRTTLRPAHRPVASTAAAGTASCSACAAASASTSTTPPPAPPAGAGGASWGPPTEELLPPKGRSLTGVVLSVLLIGGGVVGLLHAADAVSVSVPVFLACALIFVGAALLVSAWTGGT